jgi:hypothetical protein
MADYSCDNCDSYDRENPKSIIYFSQIVHNSYSNECEGYCVNYICDHCKKCLSIRLYESNDIKTEIEKEWDLYSKFLSDFDNLNLTLQTDYLKKVENIDKSKVFKNYELQLYIENKEYCSNYFKLLFQIINKNVTQNIDKYILYKIFNYTLTSISESSISIPNLILKLQTNITSKERIMKYDYCFDYNEVFDTYLKQMFYLIYDENKYFCGSECKNNFKRMERWYKSKSKFCLSNRPLNTIFKNTNLELYKDDDEEDEKNNCLIVTLIKLNDIENNKWHKGNFYSEDYANGIIVVNINNETIELDECNPKRKLCWKCIEDEIYKEVKEIQDIKDQIEELNLKLKEVKQKYKYLLPKENLK